MKKKILTMLLLCCSVYLTAQNTHIVRQGETMEKVATKYGTNIQELKRLNPNVDILFPGLLLNIPKVSQDAKSQKVVIDKPLSNVDKIEMRDGSYVLCNIINVKKSIVTIEQEGIEGHPSIPVKEISLIEYANGKKRVFKK